MNTNFEYGIGRLDVATAYNLATGNCIGILSDEAKEKIGKSQQDVAQMVADDVTVYGITTGFGILANTKINSADAALLQYKILQSHSVGVGKPVPELIARLMLITKVHALAQGFSGVQLATIERILWHIENNIIPVVPEKGSVGASGDLAPLAHLALVLIGEGEAFVAGKRMAGAEASPA